MAKKKNASSGAGCAVILLICMISAIYSGISSCVGNAASTSPPGDYSTVVPPTYVDPDPATDDYTDPYTDENTTPYTDDYVAPETGDPSDDYTGGDMNLPGNGYVSGPGANCGLSGCHVDVLPHFGFHF
jgi:hypothetical protein